MYIPDTPISRMHIYVPNYCIVYLYIMLYVNYIAVSRHMSGEGNGNPLQCSCLENPRDGGAWWAAVYGVAQSRTRLKRLSSSSRHISISLSIYGRLWEAPLQQKNFVPFVQGSVMQCHPKTNVSDFSPLPASESSVTKYLWSTTVHSHILMDKWRVVCFSLENQLS